MSKTAKRTARVSKKVQDEYDLSCPNPECRSLNNIRIAGVHDSPQRPDRWFCHCELCGKTFKPRKKGECGVSEAQKNNVQAPEIVQQKTRLEEVREKLPREKYEQMKNEGKTDRAIMNELDIPNAYLYQLKNEWGLVEPRKPKTGVDPRVGIAAENDKTKPISADNIHGNREGCTEGFPQAQKENMDEESELSRLSRRLDSAVQLINDLAGRIYKLECEFRQHRHQVGPGHWSGKEEA